METFGGVSFEELRQRLKAQEERLKQGEEMLARGRELLAEGRKLLEEMPADHELKKAEELKSLIINCLEHEILGSGRVIDPAKARATPCTCFTVEEDGFEACWSPGVLGLMTSQKNPEQIKEFCKVGKLPGGEGARERFLKVRGAISKAHERWEKKGGGLPGWWEEVAKSLEEHKIEL